MRLCRSITVPTVAKPFYQQSMPAFSQRCKPKAGTKAASHTFASLGFDCLASQAYRRALATPGNGCKLGRGGLRLLLFPTRPCIGFVLTQARRSRFAKSSGPIPLYLNQTSTCVAKIFFVPGKNTHQLFALPYPSLVFFIPMASQPLRT